MAIAFRRKTTNEDLEVGTFPGNNGMILAVIADHEANNVVQLTYDELKWLCFTSGPDIIREIDNAE